MDINYVSDDIICKSRNEKPKSQNLHHRKTREYLVFSPPVARLTRYVGPCAQENSTKDEQSDHEPKNSYTTIAYAPGVSASINT